MKKTDYNNGYNQKAKKIKSGKVCGNVGIAFGVNVALILILVSNSGNSYFLFSLIKVCHIRNCVTLFYIITLHCYGLHSSHFLYPKLI